MQDLEELNEMLLEGCRADEQRRIAGKAHAVGEAMRIELEHLLPLSGEGFELAETSFPTVDGKGCVKVRTNFYSTPLRPGTRPQAKLLPAYVEIWQERECVARHERSFGRYEQVLDLEHYLDVLEKKPGALAGSSPLILTRSATIHDGAWTDARRRDSGRFFGGVSYCPFTVHFVPKTRYIRWNGLKQAKRLTASVDSKHAGLALTV